MFESRVQLLLPDDCDSGERCNAIIMEDEPKNDLLVHGFIKKEMNEWNMNIPVTFHGLNYNLAFNRISSCLIGSCGL